MSKKIIELVNQWAAYEAERADPSLADFCLWYLANQLPAPAYASDIFDESPINGTLGKLLGRLSKYSYLYSKKALKTLGLHNVDDMMYMHVIHHLGAPNKSELIHHMLSEFPSGIDIIRRLLKLGLIEELPNAQDKRAKRVRLTSQGEGLLAESYPFIHRAGKVAFDVLTQPEKLLLVQLLERLDSFHTEHYKTTRAEEFEGLYQRMMNLLERPTNAGE
ncbi:MAG: winged helix DNA-binding protein [Ferruginibacter sp.]|nr:winged helix DNA-binding protein [Cytophagales bacterium]